MAFYYYYIYKRVSLSISRGRVTLMKESRLLMVAASPLCAAWSSFGPQPSSSSDACARACVYTYACARAHALSGASSYLCMRPWPTSVSALKLLVYEASSY